MSWRDSFDILVGDGRGQYQKDDLLKVMEIGVEHYARYKSLDRFRLPLFADVGTGKTPSTLRYLHALREFLREVEHPAAEKPVLVVCPASVKYNWIAEARRWRDDLSPIDLWAIAGNRETRLQQIQFMQMMKPKLTIVNYDLLRIHQQEFQNLCPKGQEDDPFFLAVVCDEVHAIKWRSSQRTRAVQSVMAHSHMGLTGTGMSNKPDSLWNVVTWLSNPGTFWRTVRRVPPRPKKNCPLPPWKMAKFKGSYRGCESCSNWMPRAKRCKAAGNRKCWSDEVPEHEIRYRRNSSFWGGDWPFKSRYCLLETNGYGTRVVGARQDMMPDLHRRLNEWGMVRWRRADVLQLGTLMYERVMLEATPDQASLYNQLRAGFVAQYESDDLRDFSPREIRSVLALLTYFRRATTLTPREFALALAGKNPEFAPDLKVPVSDRGAKQEWLIDFMKSELDQTDGNRVKFLIFSDWTSALKPMVRRLSKAVKLSELKWGKGSGLRPDGKHDQYIATIDGSTPKEARQEISERWNSDLDFICVCASPAAFEGINLQGGLGPEDTVYAVILNLPWMPAQVIQAIGRAYRYGQDAQVVALFPTVDQTIDLKMATTLLEKQQAFDEAIDGGNHKVAGLFDVTSGRDALDLIGSGIG